MNKKPDNYLYLIDLNERGIFSAHVEDSEGHDIFCMDNEEEEDGNLCLVNWGYMKNTEDLTGLLEYLTMMKIVNKNSTLKKGN